MPALISGVSVYSLPEAAEYCGISISYMEKCVYQKAFIKPDGKVGNYHYFTKDNLDEFKDMLGGEKVFQDNSGVRLYNVTQGAKILGITKANLSYHFRSGNVRADVLYHKRAYFYFSTLKAFGKQMGYELRFEEPEPAPEQE